MQQHNYPIGPPSELQQVYLGPLPKRKRNRLNLEHEPSATMICIRVAYRLVQKRFKYHVSQGPWPHPLTIIGEVMTDEFRLAFPYIWWQVRWLGLCLANGISLTHARDQGPARTFRAQAKTLPSIPRTKWT